MRIAYVTTDEVNQALAAEAATDCGAILCALPPKNALAEGPFQAVLYNLDDVQKHSRGEFIAQIVNSPSTCPKAVHCYDITDEQVRTLRQCGIAVAQRLHAGLIRSLCKAAQSSRMTVPSDDARTELTWVNLAK